MSTRLPLKQLDGAQKTQECWPQEVGQLTDILDSSLRTHSPKHTVWTQVLNQLI
jgi:hypothetical protein